MTPATLVIGCGNDLRGDDRVGRLVADRVAALALPAVRVRSVTQLLPELAVDLAAADRVIVVDADVTADVVCVRPVEATGPGPGLAHHRTPGSLLELAELVGHAPDTVLEVAVPARNLGLGEVLSSEAARGVDDAVRLVVELVAR